tara:strand:- start:3565 stop:5532 length:1968 start_codon:yes stop_codon:yes gene_type:complete
VFIILILIFVLQSIWLYIKELAGKDLDIEVIFKFLIYVTPKLIPLVLPLTILLSSIMVFGSFAENYEFAAMKSTGISLQRAMSGLSVFIVGIGIITFFFANNAIPWSEMKFYNLRKNIAKTKPSMVIIKGQFNQIEGTPYNIKVENKSGDNDQFLEDVTIHLKGADGRKNAKTIKAKTGEFFYDENSDNLQLILFDGNYYEDLSPKDIKSRNKKPFAKGTFEKDIINIDLSQLNNVDFDEQSQTDKYNMLDVVGLNTTLDSLADKHFKIQKGIATNLYTRTSMVSFSKEIDPTPKNSSINTGPILNVFDTKNKSQIVDATLKSIISSKQLIDQKISSFKISKIWFNKHIISFHEKFALGFACIILFFVGAPLGALIRKGGIGLPMVIAILLFLTYHFIGIFATNSGKSGEFNPILASWFSTLIMLPLGIYLTRRATADRGLFETDGLLDPLKQLFRLKKEVLKEDASIYHSSSKEYESLNKTENKKLIDIIKNFKEHNYSIKHKNTALSIINARGITNEQLKFGGNFNNQKFEETLRLKNKYEEDTNLTLILYIISSVLILGGSILNNNTLPVIGNIIFITGIVIGVIYLFSLIKSFLSSSNLNKHLGKETISNALLFLLLGLPLYFIIHLYQKRKINEELNLNKKNNIAKKDLK